MFTPYLVRLGAYDQPHQNQAYEIVPWKYRKISPFNRLYNVNHSCLLLRRNSRARLTQKCGIPLAAAQSQGSPLDSSQCRHLTPSRGPRFSLTQRYLQPPGKAGSSWGFFLGAELGKRIASYQVSDYDNHPCSYACMYSGWADDKETPILIRYPLHATSGKAMARLLLCIYSTQASWSRNSASGQESQWQLLLSVTKQLIPAMM
ncbi:hypothetical protein HDV57DRAFT_267854 [Trichoderma longibrachiatum]|uniref:Uncharacterized protein n=1 Tax=Trichoderma longibrachiatum ATCC 18648 TaxID=983965 RepID=A0A2T4BPX5_TRILO|nr:hypothetical protein M440DRAFT_1406707 [Trichoderma longibrachiatum ATCC 18648]